jgi:putative peptidoglycan lipid II flippase
MAHLVAAGVLLSRIAGLVRESVFAHFLGNSAAADAFKAGFRIPNILQNLLGEGVLSASFIPVYSRLLGDGEDETADLLAWSVGAILALAVALLVVAGVAAAPYLIDAIAPGFHGDRRVLTIELVRILFPGAGLLVMSSWCLGVLNSHHRFFASYVAPVAWNIVIIATLLYFGPRRTQDGLAIAVSWGAVAGALAQFVVQLPGTLRLLRRLQINFSRTKAALRTVFSNLVPVVASRGVIQLSGYVDNLLASLLPIGAVAALNYAQILFMLPVSLFGYSVAAAELPAMSRTGGTVEQRAALIGSRINSGLRQISFMVVPSAAAFLFLGDCIVALIFQSGRFSHADVIYVWAVLAGSAVGLLATTMGRLYNSAFYALYDTRTPLVFATIRVALTLILGYFFAIMLPPMFGISTRWGVAGLTASAGISGWVEFTLLRRTLNSRIGWTGLKRGYVARLWLHAIVAVIVATAVRFALAHVGARLMALAVIPTFGAVYFGLAWMTGMPEIDRLVGYFRALSGAARRA